MVGVDEALGFLTDWKSRKEVEEHFVLGNTASYNLIKWLLKSGYIESRELKVAHKTNRTWYYKAKPQK
jgi:hypothetical protein